MNTLQLALTCTLFVEDKLDLHKDLTKELILFSRTIVRQKCLTHNTDINE